MKDQTDRQILESILTDVHAIKSEMIIQNGEITAVCKDVSGLKKDVYGNGQPGLKTDMNVIKTKMGLIMFIGAVIITSTIGTVVASVWSLLTVLKGK